MTSSGSLQASLTGGDRLAVVTGAGGFIGSHLVELLLTRGWRVRALVHYHALGRTGHLAPLIRSDQGGRACAEGRFQVVAGDLRDPRLAREVSAGADVVFHLAALIGIPYSYQAPQAYVDVNVGGTLNLLEACRDAGVGRFLQTSTSEVYGSARYVPIDEQHPLQAQSPYAASKIAADALVESYGRSFGLPVVTVRPFNCYGPRQSARAVIPTVLVQLLDPLCRVARIGSLEPVRDWTFVGDTARAFAELAEAPAGAVEGQIFNVASGEGMSVGEMARLAMEVTGIEKPIEADAARVRPERSEVDRLIGLAERLHAATGWQPRVAMREGLAATTQWLGANLAAYQAGSYET